jgi:hypothetical protein
MGAFEPKFVVVPDVPPFLVSGFEAPFRVRIGLKPILSLQQNNTTGGTDEV